MSSPKSEAMHLIRGLPAKATWDEIMYELYVRKKIALGFQASKEGRVRPHEEVKKRFLR
jgi:hypothetical protein